jgi:hypothetical protein
MSTESAYQQWIYDEFNSLLKRSRSLQQMLLLLAIDKRIMLDYQTAVEDFRQASLLVNEWLAAKPADHKAIIAKAAEVRTQAAERTLRGILSDLASGELPLDRAITFSYLAEELGRVPSPSRSAK